MHPPSSLRNLHICQNLDKQIDGQKEQYMMKQEVLGDMDLFICVNRFYR
jgi:hypothetical protein